MKLTEALHLIQGGASHGNPYRVLLACGCTPLHLQTFTQAFLIARLPGRKVEMETGLFGNLAGTLQRAANQGDAGWHAVAVVIEWQDLDARLGYRNLGGWGPRQEQDFVVEVRRSLQAFRPWIQALAEKIPVALSLPTLELPPAFHTSGWQYSASAVALETELMLFAREVSQAGSCFLVNRDRLAEQSRPEVRLDLKSDLYHGFPYTTVHAGHLAEALARLLAPAPPLKGLITDLDDTFWGGIIGEAGENGVAWDLTSHKQLHGLYQQTLQALADQGVLIGVASKNDAARARLGLTREDTRMPVSKLFPLEIHWQAKSVSVTRILQAWNIGPDSVAFIDDSPIELAEVRAMHPTVECLEFPKDNYAQAVKFLRDLRDRFGKPRLSAEDELRRESLRSAAVWRESAGGSGSGDTPPGDFLATVEARIDIQTGAAEDPRALELVNKTNQFNLNGRRYDEGAWREAAQRPGAFVWTVAYEDKFGPLGKIAVVAGRCVESKIYVDSWVMSCRAFARRIEHQTVQQLFDRLAGEQMEFDFIDTGRNGPTTEFLQTLTGRTPQGTDRLTRQDLKPASPPLPHQVRVVPEPAVLSR